MAIRNTGLGGTDWSDGEVLDAEDLNDTFDAETSKVQSLSAFWLNSELYDVYEDFDSIATGAFAGNSDWTVSTSGGSVSISNTQNAGGTTNELYMSASSSSGTNTATVTSQTLSANKHTWCRIQVQITSTRDNGSATAQIGLNGNRYTIASFSYGSGDNQIGGLYSTIQTDMLIVAKGSDGYDIYAGGKKVGSAISDSTPELEFYVTATGSGQTHGVILYIDDVRQAKNATS